MGFIPMATFQICFCLQNFNPFWLLMTVTFIDKR
uniref:Uncharacterized protein n=1 Tax=Tetranychus urticae TaxID=32264 RepID=T1JQ62_TETUR